MQQRPRRFDSHPRAPEQRHPKHTFLNKQAHPNRPVCRYNGKAPSKASGIAPSTSSRTSCRRGSCDGAGAWCSADTRPLRRISPHPQTNAGQRRHRPLTHGRFRWKINTLLARNTTCYDVAHQPVALEQFLAPAGFEPRYVRLLVQFTHVWVNEQMNTAGLAVSILQIQQSDVAPPQTFAFLDVVPEHLRHPPAQCTQEVQTDPVSLHPFGEGGGTGGGVSVGCGGGAPLDAADTHRPKADTSRNDHPVYGKYFKMVSKGVPKPAVQHKMRMNGVEPEVLDYPPDKPLPSCGEDDASAGCGTGDQLTLSLKDTQQLRKTEINADRPKAAANGAGHGFSLNEIVSGLQSLRKTFFGSSSSSKVDDVRKADTDQNAAALSAIASRDETSLVCQSQSSTFLKLLGAKYQNGC